MWKQLPPLLTTHWEGANVILRTQNSNGMELHANREELAENSSYFKELFFSDSKQSYEDSVEVPCDYMHMLKILRAIHKSNTRGLLMTMRTPEDLVEIYRFAEKFDFPQIKSRYTDRIDKIDADILVVVLAGIELGNHDIILNCLKKMSIIQLMNFIAAENNKPLFCKKDVVFVYEKIADAKLIKVPVLPQGEITYPDLKMKRIDRIKEWFARKVAISTRNSDGKLLYARKKVLAKSSNRFREILKSNKSSSIDLNVDYTIMKIILYILRDANWCSENIPFNPVLLYDMNVFAMAFEMPTIVEFSLERLLKQTTAGCLEVVLKLGLTKAPLFIENMPANEIRDWVFCGDEDLIYNDVNGEQVTISSKATDLNLSLNDLRVMFKKLFVEYHVQD